MISKVFELVILSRCETYLYTTANQFGFKSKHATDMCTCTCIYALREFTESFINRTTSVFVTFLDASNAFDRLNHWLLFDKLIYRRVPKCIVQILVYWYFM